MLALFVCLYTGLLTASAEDSSVSDTWIPDGRYVSNYHIVDEPSGALRRSAPFKASSASDDDLLYSYNDIKDIFGTYVFPFNKWSFVTVDGFNRIFVSPSNFVELKSHSDLNHFSQMLSGEKFHVELNVAVGSSATGLTYQGIIKGNFSLYFYDSNNRSNRVEILNIKDYTANGNKITLDLLIPDTWSGHVSLGFEFTNMTSFNGYGYYVDVHSVKVSDITNKNLDNALSKFAEKIKGFFDGLADKISGFFDALAEKIKGFFIPSEGFFEETKTKFDELLSAHLGFLYQAPALVGQIFGVIKDWNPPEEPTITLPAFDFEIAEHQVSLWEETIYKFDFLSEQPWSTLYSFYKIFIFVFLSVAMINLAIKKYHSMIGGGGDENDN